MNRRNAIKTIAAIAAGSVALDKGFAATGGRDFGSGETLPDVEFHNVSSLDPIEGGGWRMSRVPATLLDKLNDSAKRRAFSPAGAEIRFNMEGDEARVTLRMVEDRGAQARELPVLAEVHHGDFFARWVEVRRDWTEIVIRRPENAAQLANAAKRSRPRFSPELVRVALPCMPEIQLLGIENRVSPPSLGQVPERSFLSYGSSITNGAFATRPGDLYPARLARALGMDHWNLGFGGGARLEPEMADWIAARDDWQFAILEMGINVVARLKPEEFKARVDHFIRTLTTAHPSKRLFCIDIFTARGDFSGDERYPVFRGIVRDAVARFDSPNVVHCDGRELLTRSTGLTLDLTHPSSEGFAEIASRLLPIVRSS